MTPGKNSKWKLEYNQSILDWFDRPLTRKVKRLDKKGEVVEVEIANDFPTFQGWCISIDIHTDTLNEWKKPENEEKYPGFSVAYKKAKVLQEQYWVSNTMQGLHDTTFAIFWGKNNMGYRDKSEVEQTNKNYNLGDVIKQLKDE